MEKEKPVVAAKRSLVVTKRWWKFPTNIMVN